MKWLLKECTGKLDIAMKGKSIQTETYGLKSRRRSPAINELAAFENDLIELVKNIQFRTVHKQLQRTLKSDVKLNQYSRKTLTPANKTSNMYRLKKQKYNRMRRNAITSTYKKAIGNMKERINEKEKEIVKSHFKTLFIR